MITRGHPLFSSVKQYFGTNCEHLITLQLSSQLNAELLQERSGECSRLGVGGGEGGSCALARNSDGSAGDLLGVNQ